MFSIAPRAVRWAPQGKLCTAGLHQVLVWRSARQLSMQSHTVQVRWSLAAEAPLAARTPQPQLQNGPAGSQAGQPGRRQGCAATPGPRPQLLGHTRFLCRAPTPMSEGRLLPASVALQQSVTRYQVRLGVFIPAKASMTTLKPPPAHSLKAGLAEHSAITCCQFLFRASSAAVPALTCWTSSIMASTSQCRLGATSTLSCGTDMSSSPASAPARTLKPHRHHCRARSLSAGFAAEGLMW